MVGQVTDKVLEKLIEDEDFVAGGQNSSNPMRNLIIKHRNVHKIQLLLKYLGLHFCFQFSSAASAVQEISASRCLSRWRTSTRSSAIMVTNYTLTNTNTNTINTQIRMTDNHWHKALRLHKHPITKSGEHWQWDHFVEPIEFFLKCLEQVQPQVSCLCPRKTRSSAGRSTTSSSSPLLDFSGAKTHFCLIFIPEWQISKFCPFFLWIYPYMKMTEIYISGMVTLSATLEIWWMSSKYLIGSLTGKLSRFLVSSCLEAELLTICAKLDV